MTIWDTLTGRNTSKSQALPTAHEPVESTPFDPTSAQDVSSFLGNQAVFDPSSLHPLAGLNQDTLDYLALEDTPLADPHNTSALPSRGFSGIPKKRILIRQASPF